jgi:hypothetical protein
MRIGKPLALVIGVITVWPFVYMLAFMVFFIVTAFSFVSAAQHPHQPPPGPGLMLYIFIPHILTMLLMFALMAFYIVHVFKNGALKDDRRVLWAVVLFMGLPFAAPIYWWLFVWRPARGDATV